MKKLLWLCIPLKAGLISAVLLGLAVAHGQTIFQKTYGGTNYDDGGSVQQTIDGGYIITGGTSSFGASAGVVYLIKTDANGDTLWTKTFGGTSGDWGNSVQQTSDGGYIVAGETSSFGAGLKDVYLIRADANGDTLWTKTFGGTNHDDGYSVQQTSDAGFIIAGYTKSFGAGLRDFYLIKTNSNGDTLWTKTFGGINDDYAYSVQQTTDGGYVIAGLTYSFGAGFDDVYLIRTDANGNTLWNKTFGGTNYDYGKSVQQTSDAGFIIAGYAKSFGGGSGDVYLIKTNTNGDTLWTKSFGGTNLDIGFSVQQTNDGGFIIAGETGSFGAGADDVYLIKTNSNGDTLWTKTFGGTTNEWGSSVQQTNDGGYVIAGFTYSFGAGDADVYLIKTDSLGNTMISPLGIQEEKGEEKITIKIYPNPFSTLTTLHTTAPLKNATLTLYNCFGQQIKQFVISRNEFGTGSNSSSFVISRDNLPSGLYFIRLAEGSQTLVTEKIIITDK